MQNPFLMIRLVFLSLLVYLGLVTLSFASWNIHATLSGALPVPGAAVFLMCNSIALCFLVALALVAPAARTARVLFECFWVAIFSVLQIAATISVTVNGPFIMCRPVAGNWNTCMSSTVLVPSAWFSTFTLLMYLFVLIVMTAAHLPTQPAIWSLTISSVPWFTQCKLDAHDDIRQSDEKDSQQCYCSKGGDIEAPSNTSQNGNGRPEQPPWAQRLHVRRGVDKPFALIKPNTSLSTSSSWGTLTGPLPPPDAPTQQSKLAQPEQSRFTERFRESHLQPAASWWERPSQYGLQFTPYTEVFPHNVDDHDLPIPLPRLSEWIRADAVRTTPRPP